MTLINLLWQFITDFVCFIASGLSSFFQFFVDLVKSLFEPVLQSIADLLPDLSGFWSNLQPFYPYFFFFDQWCGISVGFTLLFSYFTFIWSMIIVKLVIKLFIPTVG